jgi:hypothetical protein
MAIPWCTNLLHFHLNMLFEKWFLIWHYFVWQMFWLLFKEIGQFSLIHLVTLSGFYLIFDILATVLATFPKIGLFFNLLVTLFSTAMGYFLQKVSHFFGLLHLPKVAQLSKNHPVSSPC